MDAIFKHDSSWATKGVGKWAKNPGNLRCLSRDSQFKHECVKSSNNNGYFSKFDDLETGIRANVDLYARKYMGRSPDDITRIWAGNPRTPGYWEGISACFKK